jgi:hypothetical protein
MARHTHTDRLSKRQRVRAGRKKESARGKRAQRKLDQSSYTL